MSNNYAEQLEATLDELLTVLRGEEPSMKALRSPAVANPDVMFAAGWSAGWDACKQEVMKVIQEGKYGQ